MTSTPDAAPFSRPLAVADMIERQFELSIEANAEERAALAKAYDLVELSRLGADLRIRREDSRVSVSGELRADMRRICVVTLDEFETSVVEPIDICFAPEDQRSKRADAFAGLAGASLFAGDDPPDPLIDGKIDLGAIAAEFLALALDPHPRKPGASFVELGEAAKKDALSPFAGLRQALKNDKAAQ